MGLGQPTETNTHNNTRPVIKWHTYKTQPIFHQVLDPQWCKWIARWAITLQLSLLSRLAYGLG